MVCVCFLLAMSVPLDCRGVADWGGVRKGMKVSDCELCVCDHQNGTCGVRGAKEL